MPRKRPRSIYSTYLTSEEEAGVREVAETNATSINFVVRAAVRQMLGLPAPTLTVPARRTGN